MNGDEQDFKSRKAGFALFIKPNNVYTCTCVLVQVSLFISGKYIDLPIIFKGIGRGRMLMSASVSVTFLVL